MYVIKICASGNAELLKVPDKEYAQDFLQEHVCRNPDVYTTMNTMRAYPEAVTFAFIEKREGLREKENRTVSRMIGKKVIGDAVMAAGRSFRYTHGFSLEEGSKILEELL